MAVVMVKPEEVQDALKNVTRSFDRRYECSDGFIAIHNEVAGKALYYLPKREQDPLEINVTAEQRDYFLKTGYWRPL